MWTANLNATLNIKWAADWAGGGGGKVVDVFH